MATNQNTSISVSADNTTPSGTSNDDSGNKNKIKRTEKKPSSNLKKRMSGVSQVVLTVLSIITLQYVPHTKPEKRLTLYRLYAILGTTIAGLLINTIPTMVILVDWIKHPIHYNNIDTLIASPTSENIPTIIMRNTNSSSGINHTTVDELVKFSDYGKFVFFISTASGAISYFVLLVRVLWPRYIKKSTAWRLQGWGGEGEGQLHPFDDGDDIRENNSTSTKLEDNEGAMFFIFIFLNIALVIAMLLVLLCGLYVPAITKKKMTNGKYGYIQIPIILIYFYSLLCTISSCFIFSKVMYGIQNKCDNLFRGDDKTITECIRDDTEFIRMAIETQKPFELWFFIHWVMYIITSFLSLSFLFDAINEKIQGTLPYKQTGLSGIDFSLLELIFIGLFAASNSFFFLYPCIRAAGVTESRKKLILDVNKMNDEMNSQQRAFINYLQDKKFSFRLNILCAHVTFDLNIAYISIFIGLLGVLIKVGTSI